MAVAMERTPPTDLRVDVLGVEISAIDMATAVRTIETWIDRRERHYVCVTGVHGVMESRRDDELRAIHNRSGLTTPDGMPMVWAGRWAGARHMSRVYGPDLMAELCARSVEHGWRHFFYGSREHVLVALAARLATQNPGLVIAGSEAPPFRPLTDEEDVAAIARITAARPDIVWVGLSTPKQERWMAEHVERLDAAVLIGVGAAFDLVAGTLRQAPRWMQRSGLEWAFRLAVEPRRLWRRYLRNNPQFVAAVVARRPRLVVRTLDGAPTASPPRSARSA
jgi:N-acetylglucosaminyldiphosphoundecaprenol N-acetyl-beta-D-mannosaminyltransferase